MVSDSSSAGEKRKNPVSAMLKEDVEMISNDTIKGEIALMFSGMSKTQVGLEQYKQEYGSFLVTDSQKKRWQRIEDNFAERGKRRKRSLLTLRSLMRKEMMYLFPIFVARLSILISGLPGAVRVKRRCLP